MAYKINKWYGNTWDDVIAARAPVEGTSEAGTGKIIQNTNDLNSEQIEALKKYSGNDYYNINNSLRGLETATSENQATIDTMREALNNASLPNDMVVYRGTSTEALGSLRNVSPDDLIGQTFTESGFMSTSTNSAVAGGSFGSNMQMTIHAPKGSHGLDISQISQFSYEAEVLFNAGQEMQIISAELTNGVLNIEVILK